jgi:hypothetical protein
MFAQAPKGAPDMNPYPNLAPGQERRTRTFLLKFGEEHSQDLANIQSTPERYAPIGAPVIVPQESGFAVLIHYMEGGLASAELIEKWKADKKASEEARTQEWRQAQKRYKGRGGSPDYNQAAAAAETKGMSDEARAKATSYDDDMESPLDGEIPAADAGTP